MPDPCSQISSDVGILHGADPSLIRAMGEGSGSALWAAVAAMTTGISHEFRNPLYGLEMTLGTLKRREGTSLSETGHRDITRALGLVHRLGGLVDRLCALSPSRRMPLGAIDPLSVLQDIVSECAPSADLTVEIEGAEPCRVQADPHWLRHALEPVVRNAVEAMGAGGRLAIGLTVRDGWCHIDIEDTGPGIPAAIQDRLGQPFVTTKAPGSGAGLGLCLCLLTLDRLGGHLALRETGSGGTKVRVTLPATPNVQEATAP